MISLTIYLDDATAKRLHKASLLMNRSQADLAECAVAEALLHYFRGRDYDPGRSEKRTKSRAKAGDEAEATMMKAEGEPVSRLATGRTADGGGDHQSPPPPISEEGGPHG